MKFKKFRGQKKTQILVLISNCLPSVRYNKYQSMLKWNAICYLTCWVEIEGVKIVVVIVDTVIYLNTEKDGE